MLWADVGETELMCESEGAWLAHMPHLGNRRSGWALLHFGACSTVCGCHLTSVSDDLC